MTVARALADRLPGERLLYFGDTAHLPYGDKSPEAIRGYSLAIAQHLVDLGAKAIVVACNSASSVAYDALVEAMDVPVFNVIDPVVAEVAHLGVESVGIWGTKATIKSGVFPAKLAQAAPSAAVSARSPNPTSCDSSMLCARPAAAVGAWALAQWWSGWADQWLAFSAIGLVFLVPAWLWRPPVPPVVPAPAAGAGGGGASRRWMLTMVASYFAAGWGFVISATFTVAIVERQPALAGQGALAWALVGLAAMPAVFLWDRVARRLGDTRALLLAFGLQTLSVVLPAVSNDLWAALGGALGYGATFIGIVSMTLALVGRRSPGNPGKAMARLTLSYGAAQVVAPVVAGAMAQATGTFQGALWLTAAVMALGMALLATLPSES